MIRVRNAAGPSPTLKAAKSSPQDRHFDAKVIAPENSVGAWQRGHLPKGSFAKDAVSEMAHPQPLPPAGGERDLLSRRRS
jgi:hypothetical protein